MDSVEVEAGYVIELNQDSSITTRPIKIVVYQSRAEQSYFPHVSCTNFHSSQGKGVTVYLQTVHIKPSTCTIKPNMVESMGRVHFEKQISSTRNQTKPHPYLSPLTLSLNLINASYIYVIVTCCIFGKPSHQQLIKHKMQAASIYLPSSPNFLSVKSASPKTLLMFPSSIKHHHQSIQISSSTSSSVSLKKAAAAASSSEAPEVDYSSMASSVFPAEACETVGGVACDVDMFPETKLKQEPEPKTKTKVESTSVDREYLDYNSPKTVFISEACDDLGGEFCDPDYQTGVVNT